MARGYCCASMVLLSEFLLWASAVGLALCGYILTQRDIIALTGVSIPQVAIGCGALTLIVAIWGRVADYRRWQCGFYIMAISLIFLFLAEVLVVGYQQLQWSKRDENDDIWTQISDHDQDVVQSNYECCGWTAPAVDAVDADCMNPSYPYFIYQDNPCKTATNDDMEEWVLDVTIIFASFAGFHLLYTCIPCLAQAKRLQMKQNRQDQANRKVVRDMIRGRPPQNAPRGSWFSRSSFLGGRRKNQAAQEIQVADTNAGGRTHGNNLQVQQQPAGGANPRQQYRAGSTGAWETGV